MLKEIHKEMSLEAVEKLVEETEEARAYQREVSDLLAGVMTNEEEDEVEDELAALEREVCNPPSPFSFFCLRTTVLTWMAGVWIGYGETANTDNAGCAECRSRRAGRGGGNRSREEGSTGKRKSKGTQRGGSRGERTGASIGLSLRFGLLWLGLLWLMEFFVDFSLPFGVLRFVGLLYYLPIWCDSNAAGLLDMYALCRIYWDRERYTIATDRKN